MTAKQFTSAPPPSDSPVRSGRSRPESTVQAAIRRGFVVGSDVLIGKIPGIVVGYNIGGFGRFVGATYPLVVRTALGVVKCGPDELDLV